MRSLKLGDLVLGVSSHASLLYIIQLKKKNKKSKGEAEMVPY